MACRADKGDQNLSGAVKISVKRITEKAERVEEGNQMQVRNGLFQCLGIVCSEKNRAGRAGSRKRAAEQRRPKSRSSFALSRKVFCTRSFFCAPTFCATTMEVAAALLSPKELIKPSVRVAAV